jgi:hypothetical protein
MEKRQPKKQAKTRDYTVTVARSYREAISNCETLGVGAYRYGSNLVSNPDVESGVGSPDDWYTGGGTWSEVESHSPTHSLLLNPNNESQEWRSLHFPVIGNKDYRVQAFYKGTLTSGEFYLTIRWFSNPDGTGFISEENAALASQADWALESNVYTSPANAQSADILFRAITATGTLYGDDFAVQGKSTFSEGGWSVDGGGGTLSLETSLMKEGKACVKLSGTIPDGTDPV